MTINPDLASLRQNLTQSHPEFIDKVALGGGLALMGLVLLGLLYDFNQSRHIASSFDILVFLGAPVAGFIGGTIAIYILFYGAKTVLFLAKNFWWLFLYWGPSPCIISSNINRSF